MSVSICILVKRVKLDYITADVNDGDRRTVKVLLPTTD